MSPSRVLPRLALILLGLSTTACAVAASDDDDPAESSADALSIAPMSAVHASRVTVGRAHTCAILSDGAAACWGENGRGQLGRGTMGVDALRAGAVSDALGAVREISAGTDHTCATRTSDGTVACWGVNDDGEVGSLPLDIPLYFPTPITVRGLSRAHALSVGADHSCAIIGGISAPGVVWCWGTRDGNRLGDGSMSGATKEPLAVDLSFTNPTNLAAGDRFTCVRGSAAARVTCWGRRYVDAALSRPRWAASDRPWSVSFNENIASIAVGARHACVALTSGNVYCWGESSYGQTGVGGGGTPSPVRVWGVSGAVELAAGDEHTCARLANGTVSCWGRATDGQLGNAYLATWLPPVSVSGLSGVTSLGAGGATSCAIRAGVVVCWGANGSGQLGDGTTLTRTTPVYATWTPTWSAAVARR